MLWKNKKRRIDADKKERYYVNEKTAGSPALRRTPWSCANARVAVRCTRRATAAAPFAKNWISPAAAAAARRRSVIITVFAIA